MPASWPPSHSPSHGRRLPSSNITSSSSSSSLAVRLGACRRPGAAAASLQDRRPTESSGPASIAQPKRRNRDSLPARMQRMAPGPAAWRASRDRARPEGWRGRGGAGARGRGPQKNFDRAPLAGARGAAKAPRRRFIARKCALGARRYCAEVPVRKEGLRPLRRVHIYSNRKEVPPKWRQLLGTTGRRCTRGTMDAAALCT
jgi:hypothetical protein